VASNYPGSLDSFDTIASDKKTSDSVGGRTHRDMHNDLGDAVEAVQTELGTDPAGASATVKARFEVIEANDWVTAARIAANAVGSSELADNAVDTAAIADSAVTSAKIADGTIVNADISASAAIDKTKVAGYYEGTSIPEGSQTGNPGDVYLQTSGAITVTGALTWRKVSGTGNTGWRPEGALADTGQRDIRGLLENGWTAGGGYLDLVRVGNTVFLSGGVNGSAATSDTFLTIPTGFRPPSTPRSIVHFATVQVSTSAGATRLVEISGDGNLKIYGRASSDHFLGLSWPAERTWPTSLPGSA
jgi:hypothetical protein